MAAAASARAAEIGGLLQSATSLFRESDIHAPRLTAETLLAHVLGCEKSYLYAHPEAELNESQLDRFQGLVERRLAGEPTQYLTGRQEFFGLEFAVRPGVLIPRPETEHLVEALLERLRGDERILDVGVGSGAIAVSLKKNLPEARVAACDLSHVALQQARLNARTHQVPVELVRSDLLTAFRPGSLDVVASNPPYVAERDRAGLQRELAHEPESALFAGEDGLDVYRRLIPQAVQALVAGGLLALELGHDSLAAVRSLLNANDWSEPEVVDDLAGIPRVILARRR